MLNQINTIQQAYGKPQYQRYYLLRLGWILDRYYLGVLHDWFHNERINSPGSFVPKCYKDSDNLLVYVQKRWTYTVNVEPPSHRFAGTSPNAITSTIPKYIIFHSVFWGEENGDILWSWLAYLICTVCSFQNLNHVQAQHKDFDIPENVLFRVGTWFTEIVRLARAALRFIPFALLLSLMRHLTIWFVTRPILQNQRVKSTNNLMWAWDLTATWHFRLQYEGFMQDLREQGLPHSFRDVLLGGSCPHVAQRIAGSVYNWFCAHQRMNFFSSNRKLEAVQEARRNSDVINTAYTCSHW
jgi:hypothetical protein